MYIKFKVKDVFISALIIGKVENSEKITYFLQPIPFVVGGEDLVVKSVDVYCTFDDESYVLNYGAQHIDYSDIYALEGYTINARP